MKTAMSNSDPAGRSRDGSGARGAAVSGSSLLRAVPASVLPRDGYFILINRETGSWAAVNSSALQLYQVLGDGGATADRLDLGNRPGARRTYEDLHKRGLVEIDGVPRGSRCIPSLVTFPLDIHLEMTTRCNLGCRYCLRDCPAGQGQTDADMTVDLALEIIRQAAALTARGLLITFSGGEALLAFNRIVRVHEQAARLLSGRRVHFVLQTNGSLLRERQAAFLKQSGFDVGVSLDGDAPAHNAERVYPSGRGSFDSVMRGVRTLQEHGVPFGALAVLTRETVESMPDVFDFMVRQGIRQMKFARLCPQGRGLSRFSDRAVPPKAFLAASLRTLDRVVAFNRVRPPQERARVQPLAAAMASLANSSPPSMCTRAPCGAGLDRLAFTPSGDVYPCDAFIPDARMKLGNVRDRPLADIVAGNPMIERLRNRTADSIEECRTCDWKRLCGGGGCVGDPFRLHGTIDGKGDLCDYYRALLPLLVDRLYHDRGAPWLVM